MKTLLLSFIVTMTLLAVEARVDPTLADPYWMVDEEIRILKERCKMMYPIASMSICLKTQNLIVKWKGGDSYGRVIEGEIYEEVGYPKYCVMSDIQIEQLMKIE